MDEQLPPTIEPAPAAPPPSTSLWARLLNVFATPGDVFNEVKASPHSVSNWLVPILIYGLASAMSTFLILSQPAIAQQMREQQEKMVDAQVQAGKITQEQADRQLEAMAAFSGPAAKIGGSIGGFLMGAFVVVGWAFLLWLIARIGLHAQPGFGKVLEVAGLASLINSLEAVVRMLLIYGLSNPLASPSMAMILKNQDPKNGLFMLLSLVNFIAIWALIVQSIGLARLAGARFARTAIWIFGAWAVLMGILMGLGAVARKAFGG